MKYLIFDFDGVLGDTNNSRVEVIKEMEGKSREKIVLDGDQYFTKSPHTKDLNIGEESLSAMKEWAIRFGKLLNQKGFDLFVGFIEELKKIRDAKMAVVSSGSSIYIKPKLKNCGLEFTHTLSFEDHYSKEVKVEMICRDWNVSSKEVLFFTDTISDVMELRNLLDKDKIYGCAWGYQGREKLSTVLDKDHILNSFSDVQKLFK